MFSNIHLVNTYIMAELLLAEHLFAHFLKAREGYPLRLVLSCLSGLVIAYLFPVLPFGFLVTGSIMYFSLFLISMAGIFICYDEDVWSILFCCLTGYTVQHLSSSLHSATIAFFVARGLPVIELPFYLIPVILTYLVCYLIFSRDIKKQKQIHIDNTRLLLLSGAGLFINIVFTLVISTLVSGNPQPALESLLHFSCALCCVLLLCLQFGLLSNRSLELELGVVSQMLQEREKQFEASRDNIDIINQKCHDLKHQIHTLRKGNAVVDGAVLKEIEKAVEIYDSSVKTGNAALDVILTEKSLLCENSGILLTCMAEGEAIDFMAPADVYSLFGNAIDNAMEAVSRLSDPVMRSIGLSVKVRGRMVSVHVENYFDGSLRFEDGLPQTNKADKNNHGFGVKSMQTVAEKYRGFLTASADGNVFNLDILIPIQA